MLPPTTEIAGSEGQRKTALIVEGGAMRGAWAAGVLAFLHETGRRQYDLVYAASSGACSAAYFVAGLWDPGLTISSENMFHFRSRLCKKRPPAFSSC
jgi:predicted patatin/cPLA2 family phospholipase